ncbi:hypothetical protein [Prevotella sp. KH2C16]|uniref:hypothetical protein n=1 Tax=Prevotella sp. KH2C16 TaxID=1855325 RepID=UPI0008E4FACB|nr:hypothetical protein [Prevotella sp. KH2C16]SFF98469.1 hypothetical protein SAMN05216383_103108 [Prevotella sp. KH2C16]
MKKVGYIAVFMAVIMVFASCFGNKTSNQVAETDSVAMEEEVLPDSTVYGVCGEGTSMHSLELVTDGGDTLTYEVMDEGSEENLVVGGLLAGDRLAVVGYVNGEKEHIASKVINLTTLQGKWMSIDKNFEIQEGGVVKSNIKAETNPWASWKIYNGQLLLNKDTFLIDELGADSLYLENKQGIFAFKRQK